MRLLLFYDNFVRDYRGLILLQSVLQRMGHDTRVAPLSRDVRGAIGEFGPDTVVMGQSGEETTSRICHFIRDCGINLVLNTSESCCYNHRTQYVFKDNFTDWNDKLIDLQVIVNRHFDQYIEEHKEIKQKDKYRFIGWPRFDLSFHPHLCEKETEHLRQKYGIQNFNRKWLYISSFAYDEVGGQVSEGNLKDINCAERYRQEMDLKRRHHEVLSKLLPRLKEDGDVLLIKRHPWDKSSYYRDHYSKENVILIDKHDYIVPLLQISDVILHTESTVAIEGWIQRKKTISILPGFDGDRSKLKNHMQFEPIATDFESLWNFFEEYPWETRAESLKDYMPFADGKSTIRLAHLLDELKPKEDKKSIQFSKEDIASRRRDAIKERLLYTHRLKQLSKKSYGYHLLYLEQFRRQVDEFYRNHIRRYVAEHVHLIVDKESTLSGDRSYSCLGGDEKLRQAEDRHILGDLRGAYYLLQELVQQKPERGSVHALFGQVAGDIGMRDEGIEHLRLATFLAPEQTIYSKLLAKQLIAKGELREAFNLLKSLFEKYPDDIDVLWMLGQSALDANRQEAAENYFKAILKIEPQNEKAMLQLSEIVANETESALDNAYGGYMEITADDSLDNIYRLAKQKRMGKWKVDFAGLVFFCHDLLSFYIAAKDIFLQRIYDFEAATDRPVVIDGGGHIGLFTLFVKQKYPDAQVTIFEPDKESLWLLRKNMKANGITSVDLVEAGLYKESGTIAFNSDHSDGSSIYAREKDTSIQVVKLSDYVKSTVDFMKLNIEGAELDVLTEVDSKLQMIKELVLEYHGFPEIGQNLHKILAKLEGAGFRYLIHDFDALTNSATKPPFKIEINSRFFLLIYAKRLFDVTKSDVNDVNHTNQQQTMTVDSLSLKPVSRLFGFDRGQPIDRYYIDGFLKRNGSYIRGRVLEIADNAYTCKFGTDVTKSDILNVVPSTDATIVGDLTTGNNIPEAAFDCIILTQTINVIFDVKSTLKNAIKALKSGGTLLLTAPGISQISRFDMDRWGDYWRFTDKSLKMLLSEVAPEESIQVESFGNVAVAKAFLDGLALHELSKEVLDYRDEDYQVLLTCRLSKPVSKPDREYGVPQRTKNQISFTSPLVLLYHRVANDPVDAQLLAVSPENFEAHLKELAKNYRVLPLCELIKEIGNGGLKPDTVAITFDDGYLDNLLNAVPVLEKCGLHATVFVTSGMVGSQKEFWWDALERIFLTCEPLPEFLNLGGSRGDFKWDMCSSEGRLKAYKELCSFIRTLPADTINKTIDFLFKWSGIKKQARLTHRIVNEADLLELSSSPLIEIGAHGVNHVVLGLMKSEEQTYEIRESKRNLERITGQPIRLFSYPYGTISDFNEITKKILQEEGYDAGIANIQGSVNSPVDLHAIPRRLVRNWDGEQFQRWLLDANMDRLEEETLSNRMNNLIDYQYSLVYGNAQ